MSPRPSDLDATPSADGAEGSKAAPHARAAFLVLALVQATLIFTIALIMVPLPAIAIEFGLGSAQVLLLQVAYGLPFSGLLLFGGRLADRYPGRRMFVIGLVVFGLASLVAAAAPSFEVLLAMRFAQGVGGALTAPAAMAILRTVFPGAADFMRAMATWGGVSVLGAILGFIVSGVLTTWISWRWMFVVPILVAIVGLVSTRGLLPAEPVDRVPHRPGLDPLGALLGTAGIVLTSYGLIASGDYAWASVPVLGPLSAGLVLVVAFVVVERRVRDPLLPSDFLLDPCRAAGLLGMFLAAAGSVLIEYVLSLYLQQVRQWTPLTTAAGFLPFAAVLMLTNHLSPTLVRGLGPAATTIAGLLVAATGMGLLAMIGQGTTYATGLLPGSALLAAGLSLTFSGSAVLSTIKVRAQQAGLAGGVMNTSMELGPTIGLALLMSVAALRTEVVSGYAWAFGTAAALYVSAAMLILALVMRPTRHGASSCRPTHPLARTRP